MAHKDLISYQIGISHSAGKEMAGFSHTLTCCLSKLRSSLEAGKRLPRVWIQYASSMAEVFLYPSFGAPLVLLRSSFAGSEDLHKYHGGCTEVARRCNGGLTIVSGICNGCLMEMLRNPHSNLKKVYALDNVDSSARGTGFMGSRTYVHGMMNLCLIYGGKSTCNFSHYTINIQTLITKLGKSQHYGRNKI